MRPIQITPPTNRAITITPCDGRPVKVTIVPGVPGPSGRDANGEGSSRYRHVQATAALVWTVDHNLGFRPSVTVLSVGGRLLGHAEVEHVSINVLTITFLIPIAGSAHFV